MSYWHDTSLPVWSEVSNLPTGSGQKCLTVRWCRRVSHFRCEYPIFCQPEVDSYRKPPYFRFQESHISTGSEDKPWLPVHRLFFIQTRSDINAENTSLPVWKFESGHPIRTEHFQCTYEYSSIDIEKFLLRGIKRSIIWNSVVDKKYIYIYNDNLCAVLRR